MYFRRRPSLEKREEEWRRLQDERSTWDAASSISSLDVVDSYREEKKEVLPHEEEDDITKLMPTHARPSPPSPPMLPRPPPPPPMQTRPPPQPHLEGRPPPPPPSKTRPPPPPPRRQHEENVPIAAKAPSRRTRPPPPPPPRKDSPAATKNAGTPQQRKHRRPSGAKVAVLVDNWEKLAARAEEDAARIAAVLGERDKTKVRAYFEARRAAAREALANSNNVAPPTFTNVAADRSELVIEISAATKMIEWCLVGDGEEWTVAKRVPVRVSLGPGRYVFLARALDDGSVKSQVSSAVFWLEAPPKTLEDHVLHPAHRLHYFSPEEIDSNQARLRRICASCCKNLGYGVRNKAFKAGSFVCLDCGDSGKHRFEICYECALKNVVPHTTRSKPHVDLDSGGKRLWLSDPVAFEGNLTVIKPQSYPVLFLLAETIRNNPGLCLRLEGHTNSDCGLECHGLTHCANNTCLQLFGEGKGGAIGFSKARAAAVRDWLLSDGHLDPDDVSQRIVAVGLGGSRRIAQDTEGPENHLNRRVEAHIIDFVDEVTLSSSLHS